MTLMTMLDAAQGGKFFAEAAAMADLSAPQCRAAMEKLCPAIAAQMKTKAEADADLYDSLMALLADNGDAAPLDDPGALTDGDAQEDGAAILTDVYGSRNAAMLEMRKLAGDVPETALSKLAAIGATAVVAALAQSNRKIMPQALAQPLTGAQPAVSGGGIFGIIVSSLIKGVVQAAARQFAARRRRRSYTRYTTSRRKSRSTATRQRGSTSALEDIFSEILGTRRK